MTTINTAVSILLPDAVARYFEAANRFDPESAAACFTSDASVRDEGHSYIGTDAIKQWVFMAGEKYRPHATVLSTNKEGEKIDVAVRVAGQFPGSPIELTFVFLLRNDAIAELSIC